AQEHLLVRKGGDDLLADGIDMARGVAGRDRKVLPVRQDVDGDEVDRARYLAIAKPELPYVRIGHRHRYLRFDLADGAGELWRRHPARQQHLVADDPRRDDVGIPLGERDRALDLLAAQVGNARQPQPLHHLEAVAAGNLRDLVEAVVDRIGANAVGDHFELREVFIDLPRIDRDVRAEWSLLAAERRI